MYASAFATRWPPAFNPPLPTSSGVYPYDAVATALAVRQKGCGCGCKGKGSCGNGIAGLGSCGCGGKKEPGLMGLAAVGGLGAAADGTREPLPGGVRIALLALGLTAVGASAFHGYRRNSSVGSAVVWAIAGALFPIITVPVAFAQGFGDPA